jgi:hypothetical protein
LSRSVFFSVFGDYGIMQDTEFFSLGHDRRQGQS